MLIWILYTGAFLEISGRTIFTNIHQEVMVKNANGTVMMMKNVTSMLTFTIVTMVNLLTLVIQ